MNIFDQAPFWAEETLQNKRVSTQGPYLTVWVVYALLPLALQANMVANLYIYQLFYNEKIRYINLMMMMMMMIW